MKFLTRQTHVYLPGFYADVTESSPDLIAESVILYTP
jgi:hypothetical protein